MRLFLIAVAIAGCSGDASTPGADFGPVDMIHINAPEDLSAYDLTAADAPLVDMTSSDLTVAEDLAVVSDFQATPDAAGCGNENGICCPGMACLGIGEQCINGMCTAGRNGESCFSDGSCEFAFVCYFGQCIACGGQGESCCPVPKNAHACGCGTHCVANPPDGGGLIGCVANDSTSCGQIGQPCCNRVPICQSGACNFAGGDSCSCN